jgi:hypothetical protein
MTDYTWATDLRADIGGRLTGECPCSSAAEPPLNVARCADNGGVYYVRVRRVAGGTPACAPFTIQVSNGVFDT